MLDQTIWLVPTLPWMASAFIAIGVLFGFNRGEAGEKQTARVILWASALSFLYLLFIGAQTLLQQKLPGHVQTGSWISSGELQINLNFMLDSLSLCMSLIVALISLVTLKFSVNYMHREDGFQRFFMILGLFNGAMLMIILAGNAVLTFIGWEVAGVSSYLLIAYAYNRDTASENATRAFVTNRIGDAGFILAIAFSFFWIESFDWNIVTHEQNRLDSLSAAVIAGGFLLAAMAKSALVPFSSWISRALEGPTPSSAVFYGSLMVHAGVYLVIRLSPLFEQTPVLMVFLFIFGLLTALYGFLGGLVQTDIKSSLMFSTTGQVGLMFMFCGLGWFELAAWHLALHAIWRAYHFLNAPALMHLMSQNTRPVPAWLRKKQWLYTASLNRFWLDNITSWAMIRPSQSLARDIQAFDGQVVNRVVGLPSSVGAISSLAQWEEYKDSKSGRLDGDSGDVGRGQGVAGKLMEWIASIFHWFEEHLVLKGGDEGLSRLIQAVGRYLVQIEQLISQPRYLILMIIVTFIVII